MYTTQSVKKKITLLQVLKSNFLFLKSDKNLTINKILLDFIQKILNKKINIYYLFKISLVNTQRKKNLGSRMGKGVGKMVFKFNYCLKGINLFRFFFFGDIFFLKKYYKDLFIFFQKKNLFFFLKDRRNVLIK